MNERQKDIMRVMLAELDKAAIGTNEAVLHSLINARLSPVASVCELEGVLEIAETNGWIDGIRNPVKGTRWSLTAAGMAIRLS